MLKCASKTHHAVSLKSEEQEEHAPSQAQLQQAKAEIWTSGVESATGGEEGDRTSPASQSEESVEEERILFSAPVPVPLTSTVPTKPVASAPSAFSISQLLSSDSNLGKEKKEKNSLENGSSEHKIPPALEPCAEITAGLDDAWAARCNVTFAFLRQCF